MLFGEFRLCSGTDEVSVSYVVLISEGSIRIVLVKMLDNFSNADKWFLDMFCVSDSTGCLSASTNLFAASKRLSAGVEKIELWHIFLCPLCLGQKTCNNDNALGLAPYKMLEFHVFQSFFVDPVFHI